uniref:ERAP1-like C-terminal domain-containing protein n=1 Tax=Megaselia scalaris TaxID=36166 RepID=T1GAR9_MEGSC
MLWENIDINSNAHTTRSLHVYFCEDVERVGDDCQVTPVIHVLQYPGCVPKPIPSFACVGRCASYLQRMLCNFSYMKTSTPEKLFKILDKHWPVEDKNKIGDIMEFFKSWTEQVGYPVVNITLAADGLSFSVRQERFLLKEKYIGKTSLRNLTYVIPLTYVTSFENDFQNTDTKEYLPKSNKVVTINLSQKADWIMANTQQIGYYRVFYDNKTMYSIHQALIAPNHSNINENNRAQFIDDLLSFARAGYLNYYETLQMLEYIENEESYIHGLLP